MASPVPVRVRILALVIWSVVLAPLSGPTATITGLAGGVVSITRLTGLEAGLVLPKASVATAFSWYDPSGRGEVGVNDQLPLASALAVPIRLLLAS